MKLRLLFILSVFVLTFTSRQLNASPQIPDLLVYKNDTVATYNLILEQYLQSHETAKGEKLLGLSFRDGANFNCWRGYQAVYKIENDSLFLVDILKPFEVRSGKIDRISSARKLMDIWGVNFKNGRVYIDWFSGDINFPLNKNLIRWDGVFYKIFEKEKVLSIRNGKVLTDEDVVNYIHVTGLINHLKNNPKRYLKKWIGDTIRFGLNRLKIIVVLTGTKNNPKTEDKFESVGYAIGCCLIQ